ncbi:MAG: AAA family ATPase [Spirulina sp. SIO3F2]|nr:AAA family ATPase [Spirulina sp. SIO3F2]
MMLNLTDYQETELLYTGTRTLVYRALRLKDERPVIVKVLQNPQPPFNELVQFRNQYIIIQNLDSPLIVRPLALERYGNSYALVMPDEGAVSLPDYWQERAKDMGTFLPIAIQLAQALHELSQQRIIHKDIKPANIIIHPTTGQVKLIDFSISTLLPKETQSLQPPNQLEGSLAYISPEQTGRMNRGIDYRSDFYALGVTFYELLTGQLPFASPDRLELVHCHIAKAPPLAILSTQFAIPDTLVLIIQKLMAKNAEDRYQSALGLKSDLENCLRQWQTHGTIKPFELGEQDESEHFNIPEKLYGRDAEVQTLLAAFDRVAVGGREMMLVAGFSGIGKTAVVNEVHKPIVRHSGYFIEGKFDQFNRNIPFSAFVQAFRDLMGQLLGESDAELARWQTKILAAVGENGQVLIEVIPELERIIGEQPPAPELSGSAAQNRFNLLFEKFIAVFTTPEHPLTIFIDDWQWADSASLNLMKVLMGDNQTGYLLLLGAYRDNEVFPTHPLMLTLAELEKQQTTISTITLTPLSNGHINQLVAETLSCTTELATSLTDLVYQKTQGNPFFTNRFLNGLHEDQLITFNQNLGHWQWDLVAVQDAALTDNVVEFMARRLQKLPCATQDVLKLAACIGNQFDLETLTIVCEMPTEDVAAHLWSALREGLILPQSQAYKFFQGREKDKSQAEGIVVDYRFLHDRVQQAAYLLIPDNQKQATHYRIGQQMFSYFSLEERDEKIFDIVNQINVGRTAITNESEKEWLIDLNCMAGQKAKGATAYTAAKTYFKVGIEALGADAWQTEYEQAFKLYLSLAETEFMSVDLDALDYTLGQLMDFAKSPLDRAQAYVIKVNQSGLQGAYEKAIATSLEGLKSLGIVIEIENIKELFQTEFEALEKELENYSMESLLNLPTATDPKIQVALGLLMNMISSSYLTSNFELYSYSIIKNIQLSLEYGNTHNSISAYANYGLLLGVLLGHYHKGVEIAELAIQLSYKLNSKSQRASACFLLGGWIHVWAKPIQGAAETNYEGFLAGMDSGELQYGGYNLFANLSNRLFQGENLATIAEAVEQYWPIAEKLQNAMLLGVLGACESFFDQVSRTTNSPDLQSGSPKAQLRSKHQDALQSNHLPLSMYYILQMHAACLSERFEEGIRCETAARQVLTAIRSATISGIYYFYGSLNLWGQYWNLTVEERQDALKQIEANQAQLRIWSDSCPENFLHKYELVEAEKCRIFDQKLEAIDLYDRAIAGAKANQYRQEEALANELAAKFYLDWGKEKVARTYMVDAYYSYSYWGATVKVQQLEATYPQLLRSSTFKTSISDSPTLVDSSSSTTSHASASLDVAALMKASQSITSEIIHSQLLTQLMTVLLENAGAQSGFLILETDGTLQIEAGVAANGEVEVLQSIPLDDVQPDRSFPALCPAIVNYVVRTHQSIVLNDACHEGNFTNQPYLQNFQVKSVLCVPLVNQGQLRGVVYLENNLTTAAFSRDRLEIIKLLSSQAAIALENARFYQTLEDKVAERTSQLAAANTEITQLNERLKAENLRMGAELDVAQRVQEMILPRTSELTAVPELDIAGSTTPADEVGGDYYDVLVEGDVVTIAIGDVTGHGLESGLVMMMAQTTVRTLTKLRETDPVRFLNTVNATLYDNVQRMGVDRNLTLAILNYAKGRLSISGQHEEVLLVRAEGSLQRLDTLDLGMIVGLIDDIGDFINHTTVELQPGDGIVLYTDGIPEAKNTAGEFYGLDRLCAVLQSNWQQSSQGVLTAALADFQDFISDRKVIDDITLLVLKQR